MRRGLLIFILFLMIGLISVLALQRAVPLVPVVLTLAPFDSGYEIIGPENVSNVREVRTLTLADENITLGPPIYSPDGHSLVSAASDGRIYLWDVTAGQIIRIFESEGNDLVQPFFSPDGHFLITKTLHASVIDTIDVWNAHTGDHRHTLNSYTEIAVSSTGQVALRPLKHERTAVIEIWDGFDGPLITMFDAPEIDEFFYNADGRFFLTKEELDRFDVLRTDTWNKVLTVPTGYSYDFNPEKNILAVQDNSSVEVWDIATQTHLQTFPAQSEGESIPIRLSPDGRMISIGLATEQGYFSGYLYDLTIGQLLDVYLDDMSFRYTPDNRLIASLYSSDVVRFWNAETYEFIASLEVGIYAPDYIPYGPNFAISPDGRTLATRKNEKTLKIWAVVPNASICTVPLTAPDSSAILSPETIDSMELLRRFEILGPGGMIEFLISPNNQFLVASTTDFVYAWELNADQAIPLEALSVDLYTEGRLPLELIGFSNDSQFLVLTQGDQRIVRSVRTGENISVETIPVVYDVVLDRPGRSILSPDGRLRVTGQNSDEIVFSDTTSGTALRTITWWGESLPSAFSPDGQYFMLLVNNDAGQSYSNTLYLWGLCNP